MGSDGVSEIAAEKLADTIVRNGEEHNYLFFVPLISPVLPRLLLASPRSFLFLRGGEALGLFAADRAFPHVISTAIVSHRFLYSPACCVVARANLKQ